MKDLDNLSFPAWEKFDNSSRTYFILSERGCPYRCAFCMRALGTVLRDRSPENVVEEIEWLVNNCNPKTLIFIDETFTAKKKRVYALTDLLLKKGLDKKIKMGSPNKGLIVPIWKYLCG